MRGVAAFLALGLMSATAASAADVAGWYAGIYAGPAMRGDADIATAIGGGGFNTGGTREFPDTVAYSPTIDRGLLAFANLFLSKMPYSRSAAVDGEFHDGTMSFEAAPALDLVAGYRLGNGWRVEAGFAGAQFDADEVSLDPGYYDSVYGSYLPSGDWFWLVLPFGGGPQPEPGRSGTAQDLLGVLDYSTRADFFLLSGWYDFDTATAITPYVGGGIGLARLSSSASFDCACGRPPEIATTGSRIVPAAQLGAGVQVRLADPVTLDVGYRYRMAADTKLDFAHVASDGLLPSLTAIHQSGLLGIHALTAGLTFAFN